MIQEIIAYRNIVDAAEDKIGKSPYKKGYIIEQIGIPAPTFYRKLKTKTFSVDEMLKLAKLLAPEEYYLQELRDSLRKADDDIKSGRVKSHKDVMEAIKRDYSK